MSIHVAWSRQQLDQLGRTFHARDDHAAGRGIGDRPLSAPGARIRKRGQDDEEHADAVDAHLEVRARCPGSSRRRTPAGRRGRRDDGARRERSSAPRTSSAPASKRALRDRAPPRDHGDRRRVSIRVDHASSEVVAKCRRRPLSAAPRPLFVPKSYSATPATSRNASSGTVLKSNRRPITARRPVATWVAARGAAAVVDEPEPGADVHGHHEHVAILDDPRVEHGSRCAPGSRSR